MANREAIYDRLPMEYLMRMMNDDALVHRGSTPSNIFKAGRMIGPPSSVGTQSGTPVRGMQRSPIDELIKGL